jgi:uncharacterized coiled-coil protein SlyX
MSEIAELAERLTELEIRFMEQGLLVDTLEALVREQAQSVARLERQVQRLLSGPDDAGALSDSAG